MCFLNLWSPNWTWWPAKPDIGDDKLLQVQLLTNNTNTWVYMTFYLTTWFKRIMNYMQFMNVDENLQRHWGRLNLGHDLTILFVHTNHRWWLHPPKNGVLVILEHDKYETINTAKRASRVIACISSFAVHVLGIKSLSWLNTVENLYNQIKQVANMLTI